MYLVGWCANLMRDWVDAHGLESFFYVRVNLFLCEYLGTPLCDKVYGMVILLSLVLYFYNVIWDVYCVARGHVCVPCVCSPLFLGRSSFHVNMRGDGFVCCVVVERQGLCAH